ncbi:prolyl aminopeptidase [Thalassotalea maritima]|uniref:prolyl aminopeptidase n=1 Tax=Thalassotalea maritima TaxID=3242416 RepID=UPI003526F857
MRSLYPKININRKDFIERDGHRIYVEQSGAEGGIPVVYLHGGPGGASSEDHRRYFNPLKYRIIVFDQRGCGKSTPHAATDDNTTAHLIEDMEEIRELLAIERWLVAGGSWGTTLALAYGQQYPQRVTGFILRGIFLGTDDEVDWLYGHDGAAGFFPEYYRDFCQPISGYQAANIVSQYHALLTSSNELTRVAAAKAWTLWENRISALHLDNTTNENVDDNHGAIAMASIENHYFVNHCFLEPNQLLANMAKISHLPAYIIHGRYDMVCQLKQAYKLSDAWSNARLEVIPKAGHSGFEEGTIDAIIQASDAMALFLENKK